MEQNYCMWCGTRLERGTPFCTECGTPAGRQTPENADPSAPAAPWWVREQLVGTWSWHVAVREDGTFEFCIGPKAGLLVIGMEGDVRISLGDPVYAVYVGQLKPENDHVCGMKDGNGGMVGGGSCRQPGFRMTLRPLASGDVTKLFVCADMMPHPVNFPGFQFMMAKS